LPVTLILYNKRIKRIKITQLKHSSAKFFLAGLAAFGFDYLVLLFLYYILNIQLEVATAIGFISGFAISFTANRHWVFNAAQHKKRLPRQITEYIILVILNFFFTVVAVSLLNDHGIKPFIGKLVVMALVMCWNYAIFRWVIFVAATTDVPTPL